MGSDDRYRRSNWHLCRHGTNYPRYLVMSIEVVQTIAFCLTPLAILLLLADYEDDDDEGGGGMMMPAYNPTS